MADCGPVTTSFLIGQRPQPRQHSPPKFTVVVRRALISHWTSSARTTHNSVVHRGLRQYDRKFSSAGRKPVYYLASCLCSIYRPRLSAWYYFGAMAPPPSSSGQHRTYLTFCGRHYLSYTQRRVIHEMEVVIGFCRRSTVILETDQREHSGIYADLPTRQVCFHMHGYAPQVRHVSHFLTGQGRQLYAQSAELVARNFDASMTSLATVALLHQCRGRGGPAAHVGTSRDSPQPVAAAAVNTTSSSCSLHTPGCNYRCKASLAFGSQRRRHPATLHSLITLPLSSGISSRSLF